MDNVRMKNVETQYLKVPEYRRDVGTSHHNLADIKEHAVNYPIFDLVTPKDEDSSSVTGATKK